MKNNSLKLFLNNLLFGRHLHNKNLISNFENAIESYGRFQFLKEIERHDSILEIGPFANPLVRGGNVTYCDVLGQSDLIKRIELAGGGLDISQVPYIHHVMDERGLDSFEGSYDCIVSSHNIEHQPDLISHLQQVEKKLNDSGLYYLIIPDKSYCFDRFISESTIAQVLSAFYEKRKIHTLQSIIEHRSLTVHNDAIQHWNEPAMCAPSVDIDRVKLAIDEWINSNGTYIDVHAWYFTPKNLVQIIKIIKDMRLINLSVKNIYPTEKNSLEFFCILKKSFV